MKLTYFRRLLCAVGAILCALWLAACDEVPTANDTEKPVVSITDPEPNSTATDSLVVTVNASDNVAVAFVEVYVSGRTAPMAVDSVAPYVLMVPLADISPGPRQFYATAYDAAGNSASTDPVSFTAARTPGLRFLGRVLVNGTAVDVTASGNVAVLAAGDGGVVAFDISNVYVPRFIGRYRTGNPILGVALKLPVIYAGAGDGTILALSTSVADTLISAARLVVSGIHASQLSILNTTLSVAGGTGGLLQLNASQADTLIQLGRYDQGGDVRDVELVGQYAYIAEAALGMRVLDVSKADSIDAVYHFLASTQASDVYIAGTNAYLADGNSGVYAFSIANLASPVYLSNFNPVGRIVNGVKGQGRWLYTANGDVGVDVIDANNPNAMVAAPGGTFNTIGYAHKVAAHNGYVLVADNEYFTILKYVEP